MSNLDLETEYQILLDHYQMLLELVEKEELSIEQISAFYHALREFKKRISSEKDKDT